MHHKIELPESSKPRLSGLFKIEAVERDGSVRLLADWFENLITNQGLERLGNAGSSSVWSACQVGTSATSPTVSDTSLGSFLAGVNSRFSSVGAREDALGYGYRRNVYAFAEGAVVGNIAEVATAWAATGATIFSRALIKDSMGSPTTISVLADETLRVTWEVRVYWPTVDTSGSVVFTGNIGGTYNWTCRAASIGGTQWIPSESGAALRLNSGGGNSLYYSPSSLGAITGVPTGSSLTINTYSSQSAYVPGSLQSKGVFNFPLAAANGAGGIQSIKFQITGLGEYQLRFDTPIPKTASDAVSLTVGHSWARR